ncbi:GNAT family N-acetyltransferase [Anaerococcus martiniensis]|uniref:GNAT family N-acetyltransferase n=1 Tax=Anaerococcus sp. WGS1579 TaxID=3366809 RepID=UPI00372D1A09
MYSKFETPRVYIEKINRETALGFKNWGEFDDPRLSGYNYGGLTDFEINFWYNSVTTPRKKYFAVKRIEDDRFIGFMGLKNYNPLTKKAKLGIVFDPNFVSLGYGYESMSVFLDYYFNELKFREMILEVNLFNQRAINLYKKLGFKECGHTTEVFENQNIDFDQRYFEGKRDIIFSKILIMNLKKDDYYEL